MNKKITLLGSTGSIGKQVLDVADNIGIEVVALSANKDIDTIEEQIRRFRPRLCAIRNEKAALLLDKSLKFRNIKCDIMTGSDGLNACASIPEADTCVSSIVGIAGLVPTMHAIKAGKDIALANKETLVTAGKLVFEAARENNVKILPIDSEHAAIFQCLLGNDKKYVNRLILTASGGPFRGKDRKALEKVKVSDALAHPTWRMGSKITIDSATLMNKGLEVIEARWLFDMPADKIDVIIHPQSVIHSMVEYCDGTVMAQMGTPDMRLPIALALTYPERKQLNYEKLDFTKLANLSFEAPDIKTFRCLELAYSSINEGGTCPTVMNGANEACVDLFLKARIGFNRIAELIEDAMCHVEIKEESMENIIEADRLAREFVYSHADM